jgi:lysine 2,3-aminomutase
LPGIDPQRLTAVVNTFPMRINSYFLSLIRSKDDPLGRQVIPAPEELEDMGAPLDPLTEEKQSPSPLVIHRYPRRVVFLVSNQCAVYCRFCTRKRLSAGKEQITATQIDRGLRHIADLRQIDEVVLSGGDPLMIDDHRLMETLSALRDMPHIKILRIHTRMPCVLPQRITARLGRSLSRFRPLYINIHFNHPDEITASVEKACGLLADSGLPLGSQTVLLNGVNDDPSILAQLMTRLLSINVRPYYLHQLDRVRGTSHFQVPLERSLELVASLRGHLSGLAVPHFMVDLPSGGGKVALTPDAVAAKGEKGWWFRNWRGDLICYPSP